MSKVKIIQSMKSRRLHREPLNIAPNVTIQESFSQPDFRGVRVYRFDAHLGATQAIDEQSIAQNPEVVDAARDHVIRAVIRQLYGEINDALIDLLIELRKESYEYARPATKIVEDLIDMTSY